MARTVEVETPVATTVASTDSAVAAPAVAEVAAPAVAEVAAPAGKTRRPRSPSSFTGVPVVKEIFEAWATSQVPTDPNIPAYSRAQLRAMFVRRANLVLAELAGVEVSDEAIRQAQAQATQA